MKMSDEKFLQWWPKKRKKGKEEFIVIHGILAWALPVGVGIDVINRFFVADRFFPTNPFFSIPIWAVTGIWYGNYIWKNFDKRYAALTSNK